MKGYSWGFVVSPCPQWTLQSPVPLSNDGSFEPWTCTNDPALITTIPK